MIDIHLKFGSFETAAAAMYALAGLNDPDINAAMVASPETSSAAIATAQAATEAAKRPRRTKAEMDAARAAEAAAAAPGAVTETPVSEALAGDAPATVAEAIDTDAAVAPVVEPVTETPAAKPLSADEIETKRREVARPALQAIIAAGGNDAARAYVVGFGYPGLKDVPADRLDEFTAGAQARAAELLSKKAA